MTKKKQHSAKGVETETPHDSASDATHTVTDPHRTPATPDPKDFDPEEAEVSDEIESRARFADALASHGFADTLVVSRDDAEDIFHDRRIQIIEYLSKSEPDSVRALSRALGIDKSLASRDLQKLTQLDIVQFEDTGRTKSPRLKHRHVVIEPVV